MIVIPADVSCKLGLAAVGGAACAVGHLDPEAAPSSAIPAEGTSARTAGV